jgi:hypothetical protein
MADSTGWTPEQGQALAENGNRIATDIIEKGMGVDGVHSVMSLLNIVQAMVVRRVLDGIGDGNNFRRGDQMLDMSCVQAKEIFRNVHYDVDKKDVN